MSAFVPKSYQQNVLDSVEAYFRACHAHGDADTAFYAVTKELWGKGIRYHPIAGFPEDMPYFCLRIPTGGGKTWLAAKAVRLVNTHLLRSEYSVILWLVPSNAIREQTLKTLKDRNHPYHAALREAGPVTVLDLDEAKSVTRATLETSTTVIVSTIQAFKREDTEGLKVYASNGALMHHFDGLTDEQRAELLMDEASGTAPCSLANVLRLRRPFVIVDEAHNNRTDLSFDTLARFRPSGIMELTATPDTEHTPSNVLHSVGAGELKAEEMIKLPILLTTEPDADKCLANAIARRDALHDLARQERMRGEAYLRPVVLIQAEPRRTGVETRDVDWVFRRLTSEDFGIPPEEIVIATGERRGLEELADRYEQGILDEGCPVKYVVTQRALAEGWDCPFAYVLASMAEIRSATAIEQLLGRILRQPDARHRPSPELNQSYAFVVSRDFGATAASLRDGLVNSAGFNAREAGDFVTAASPEQQRLDFARDGGRARTRPVVVHLPEKPAMRAMPKSVRDKLEWDAREKTLTIRYPLGAEETKAVKAACPEEAREAIDEAVKAGWEAVELFQSPADKGKRLQVPQMALRIQGELELFDDPEVLDYPWDLSGLDASPTPAEIKRLNADRRATGGEIDVVDGKVTTRFLDGLQLDLGMAYRPEHWDETRLAAWLCRNLPEPTLTHASKMAFVAKWLTGLLERDGFDLGRLNRQKFLLRGLLEERIRAARKQAASRAWQQTLFSPGNDERVHVGEDFLYDFHPQGYAPNRDYDGRFGAFDFRKHYYARIGDFDSSEEFQCAVQLDIWAQQGRIEYWVRNLARKPGCSFFLQKATDRFYPDFICKLPDGVMLAVEYKGADRWADAREDRMIGELWERMSGGRCRFVMVRDKRWEWIEARLSGEGGEPS